LPSGTARDSLNVKNPEMDHRQHWDSVYRTATPDQLSWFEALPTASIQMMEAAGLTADTCVIDVGGGDSRVVDALVARGLDCVAVLDISETALCRAQTRLGSAATPVTWIEADVTGDWTLKPMDIWHDRAVFHFLVASADRERYKRRLQRTLRPHGAVIIATFAADGPERCSGLPVVRYSPEALAAELGDEFRLIETAPYLHRTPWGSVQSFQYSRFARVA
jgi:SAM-dependent methyltransferase